MNLKTLLKRKKLDGEEPKNNFDKATTFIKNNVGKLAALSFAPLIAEELAASYKGEKLAKAAQNEYLHKKPVMPKSFMKAGGEDR